ncbi:MAG TPA: hypothetical protein VET88_16230 [Gammaproteobacteria bacterium]|nr:hypothetical protein [Gammaproteobacteria bacterium]
MSDSKPALPCQIEKIKNPDPDGVVLDLQHHFRIDLKLPGNATRVSIPVNPEFLRNTDIDTLGMVRYHEGDDPGYSAAGNLQWSPDGEATIEITESGIYSLVGAPADALSRRLLQSYCGNRRVPRVCQQIDCARESTGQTPVYTPGMPPCAFCERLQPEGIHAGCLLDIRDVLFPPLLHRVPDDEEGPVCEFRKVFPDDSFCFFRPQADDEQECRQLAEAFGNAWGNDLTGRPCPCGTRVEAFTWDPPPNGCTDALDGALACVGWHWNREVVSDQVAATGTRQASPGERAPASVSSQTRVVIGS